MTGKPIHEAPIRVVADDTPTVTAGRDVVPYGGTPGTSFAWSADMLTDSILLHAQALHPDAAHLQVAFRTERDRQDWSTAAPVGGGRVSTGYLTWSQDQAPTLTVLNDAHEPVADVPADSPIHGLLTSLCDHVWDDVFAFDLDLRHPAVDLT